MRTADKARAFTLLELLVVVSIIAVLVAILAPSLNSARVLTRTALCQNNLSQIGRAFHANQAQYDPAASRFPEAFAWPGVPYASVSKDEMFRCPEDDLNSEWNPMGGWTITTPYGPTGYYVGGRFTICMDPPSFGCDKRPKSGYTEYVFEDGPGIVTNPASWGYDGTFWVYDLPGKGKKVEWHWSSCGEDNRAWLYDKPFFPDYGDVKLASIPHGTFRVIGTVYTSYAFNKLIEQRYPAPDRLVLLDYFTKDGAVADPSMDIWPLIQQGARHRNRCNVLLADDHVEIRGATTLDPKLNLRP